MVGPLRETSPFAPRQVPSLATRFSFAFYGVHKKYFWWWLPGRVLVWGEGGGFPKGADHFFIPSVTHMFNMGGNEFDYELMNKNELLEFRASYEDFSESMTYSVLSHRNGQKTSSSVLYCTITTKRGKFRISPPSLPTR